MAPMEQDIKRAEKKYLYRKMVSKLAIINLN